MQHDMSFVGAKAPLLGNAHSRASSFRDMTEERKQERERGRKRERKREREKGRKNFDFAAPFYAILVIPPIDHNKYYLEDKRCNP